VGRQTCTISPICWRPVFIFFFPSLFPLHNSRFAVTELLALEDVLTPVYALRKLLQETSDSSWWFLRVIASNCYSYSCKVGKHRTLSAGLPYLSDFCLRHSTYPRPQYLRPSESESVSVAVELSKFACDISEFVAARFLILRLRLWILASCRVSCVVSNLSTIPQSEAIRRFAAGQSNGLDPLRYQRDRKISTSAFPITEAVEVRLYI
jgi:hypothetical protein